MNTCPFADKNVECDLPMSGTEGGDRNIPNAAYCRHCEKIAFRCPSGHWNRPFARFCTQCGHKLEKPEAWEMAAANPQRTATVSRDELVDSLPNNFGFTSWSVDMPRIETRENLPGLLAIDGLVVVPNSGANRLDAYTIAKRPDQRQLHSEWSIEFNGPLTYGSTPIYHELHLFYVVSGGIEKKSVLGGQTDFIEINRVDTEDIEPVPGCAPLKCEVAGRPAMVVGLKQGVLLFELTNQTEIYIPHKFFRENKVMSPVLCGKYVVFTAQQGRIFSLNIGTNPFTSRLTPFPKLSFSAPVACSGRVYLEALNGSGERSLACYEPARDKLSKVSNLDRESADNLNQRRFLFVHPPLTDGKRLFLSDRYGQTVYIYDSDSDSFSKQELSKGNSKLRFVPHQALVVDNRIYSAHSSGLTLLDFEAAFDIRHRSLAMGHANYPVPVAPPIRYGDKLFVLCEDRLICVNI